MKNKVRILVVDDNEEALAYARRYIEEEYEDSEHLEVDVVLERDFSAGIDRFGKKDVDIVVLDVFHGAPGDYDGNGEAGLEVYEQIRDVRFAPVVFWTGTKSIVDDLVMPPLVSVAGKDSQAELLDAINNAIQSHAASIIDGIERDVAKVLREHMWEELAPNWAEYTSEVEAEGISYILLTRLARVIEDSREEIHQLQPGLRYIYPPASDTRAPGDIMLSDDGAWWVVLTPACDLAHDNKVGFTLLSRATRLVDHEKYVRWRNEYSSDRSNGKRKKENYGKAAWDVLKKDVLMSTRGRFHFLPAFREIPDLVIDLEDVIAEPGGGLSGYSPKASLSSPFAEALLVQHSHHRGRIGIPDLDCDFVRRRLRQKIEEAEDADQNV